MFEFLKKKSKENIIIRKTRHNLLEKWFSFWNLFLWFISQYITNSSDKQVLELLNSNSDLISIISKISQRVWMLWFWIKKDWMMLSKPRFKKLTQNLDKLFWVNWFETFKKDFYSYLFASWEIFLYKILDDNWKFKCFEILPNKIILKKNISDIWVFESITLSNWKVLVNNIDIYWFQKDKKYSSENSFNSIWILESIKLDLLQDLEIQKRNIAYYSNLSLPSFILKYDKEVPEDIIDNSRESFNSIYQWSENYWKVLHSTNIDWVEKLENKNNNTYEVQRQYITERLCALLWIDKETLWYKTSNWSEAKLKEINNDINSFTIPAYAKFLEYVINSLIKYNYKEIEVWESLLWLNIVLMNAEIDNKLDIETSQREDLKIWIYTINEVREKRWEWLKPIEELQEPLQNNNLENGTKESSNDEKAHKT